MTLHAFKLTDEAKEGGFSGGTVVCTTLGHTFDIGEALGKEDVDGQGQTVNKDGVIVVDDDIFAQVLRAYPALESTEVPQGAEPVEIPGAAEMTAPTVPPHQSQTPNAFPQAQVEFERGAGEVPAEHADDPVDEKAAVAAGESVSGSRWSKSSIPDDND